MLINILLFGILIILIIDTRTTRNNLDYLNQKQAEVRVIVDLLMEDHDARILRDREIVKLMKDIKDQA